ncbi:MAG: hypothetical protein ACOX6N_00370 [Patescibacteria group bacterium]
MTKTTENNQHQPEPALPKRPPIPQIHQKPSFGNKSFNRTFNTHNRGRR